MRLFIAVALSLVLVGCGDDDCAEPGVWTCKYTLNGGNCPAGTVATSWLWQLALEEEACGTVVDSTTLEQDGCALQCSIELHPQPGQISGKAGCNVVCPTAACTYTASVVCSH